MHDQWLVGQRIDQGCSLNDGTSKRKKKLTNTWFYFIFYLHDSHIIFCPFRSYI